MKLSLKSVKEYNKINFKFPAKKLKGEFIFLNL